MRNTKKAFTLVELIVVITILAILATIAFISLQGYSTDSKNAKVNADLRTMVSAIETGVTKGNFFLNNIIAADSDYSIATGSLTAGYKTSTGASVTAILTGSNYLAGTLDFTVINQNGDDFTPPNGLGAAYGAAYGTVGGESSYQLAGQTVNEAGEYTAVVKGNYVVKYGATALGLLGDTQGTDLTSSGLVNGQTSTTDEFFK